MIDYDHVSYGDAYDTRCDIVDSLKEIYDDISDTSKFMVYAMVHPIRHESGSSTYRVHAGFGWGEAVDYVEDEPLGLRTSWHWKLEAPQKISNVALSLYGYNLNGLSPNPGFYHNIEYRSWNWYDQQGSWGVISSLATFNYVNLTYGTANPNYLPYRSFWQNMNWTGTHNNLSGDEMNHYIAWVYYGLINNTYGHPSAVKKFCGIDIVPSKIIHSGNVMIKYHLQKHYFGVPMQSLASNNYQLELANWQGI